MVLLQAKLRKRNKEETAESYFLAGRSLVWWMVGGSLFASNIGGSQFIGVSGDAAATGIAVVSYEWQVCYSIFGVVWYGVCHGLAWYAVVRYGMVWYGMHGMVWYGMVDMVWYLFIYLFIKLCQLGQGHHNSICQLLWALFT